MNKTITAKYTDSIELLTFFAMEKGWTAKIPNPELPVDNEWEAEIDNPVSVEEFISNWATRMLKEQIGDPAKQYVREQIEQQIQAEHQRIDGELDEKLKVTVS